MAFNRYLNGQMDDLNPISIINQLHSNSTWTINQTYPNGREWIITLTIPDWVFKFSATVTDKEQGKQDIASQALSVMRQRYIDFVSKSTKQIQDDHCRQFQLPSKPFANKLGNSVVEKYTSLFNLKDSDVIAAIVVTDSSSSSQQSNKSIDIVCMASGTKHVKRESLMTARDGRALVVDCHAEILVKRAFRRYLYQQIKCVKNNNTITDQTIIIEKQLNNENRYRLKSTIGVHLFISKAPCGDASVFNQSTKLLDDHPEKKSRALLRAKIEAGMAAIPTKNIQGRFAIMSCSDKIAVWSVCGIQFNKTSNYSFVWIKDIPVEEIDPHTGLIRHTGQPSCLSKQSLYVEYCSVINNITDRQMSYELYKKQSLDYCSAKTQCIKTLENNNFGPWIHLDDQLDQV
ncbi:double-stranded RNA-specific editase Adar-like [Oppia nitens]|uniref:double-stranded RNA-specific editase Adar-like n=1 Tax=Oppia nitens TaxID=1686743 RepID=UPI0023DB9063|nr:double-stranded RNA-specific editase Adar-like [Oppia nitens]